jgi:hypothetical protein
MDEILRHHDRGVAMAARLFQGTGKRAGVLACGITSPGRRRRRLILASGQFHVGVHALC